MQMIALYCSPPNRAV